MPTGGYGGWEAVSRPKRVALTRFKGHDPFLQDVPVMFDGFADGISQEVLISKLELMARAPTDLREPPKIKLTGPIPRKELTWVINDISWDNQTVIWDGEERVRQAATVHLMQFVDDTVLSTVTSPAVTNNDNNGKKTKITAPQGMNLKQIAMLVYKDPSKYVLILDANPFLNPDPRAIIPAGTPLFIPTANGFTAKTITVP